MALLLAVVIVLMQLQPALSRDGDYFGGYGAISVIIEFGRPLALIFLFLLGFGLIISNRGKFRINTSVFSWIFLVLFLVFSLKYIVAGELAKGTQGFLLVAVQLLVASLCFYHSADQSLGSKVRFMTLISVYTFWMFSLLCIYLIFFYADNSFNYSDRFHGPTSNPNHTALLVALCFPGVLFYGDNHSKARMYVFYGLAFAVTTGILIACGSRTSMLAVALSFFCWLFVKLASAHNAEFGLVGKIAVGIFLLVMLVSLNASVSGLSAFERGNTRAEHWLRGVDMFLLDPLLGAPLQPDGTFLLVENTWIAASSTLGLFGLFCSILLLWLLARQSMRVVFNPRQQERAFVSIASVTILVCSFGEAFLLGFFKGHTFLALLLLAGAPVIFKSEAMVRHT